MYMIHMDLIRVRSDSITFSVASVRMKLYLYPTLALGLVGHQCRVERNGERQLLAGNRLSHQAGVS